MGRGNVRRAAAFLSALTIVQLVSPVFARAEGPNVIVSPRPQAVVARGAIPVHVHVAASLVGKRAGIMTVPGWSLRLDGQPRSAGDYNLFQIRSQSFTVRAPAPRQAGRYTIRINRDSSSDHSAIAQVRVTFRNLAVTRFRASLRTFFPLVRDGYRDCTRLRWIQTLSGHATLLVGRLGHIDLGHRRAGAGSFRWCGTVGGRVLRKGVYNLRVAVRDDLAVDSTSSQALAVKVTTAHLLRKWTVVQSGDKAFGYRTYHPTCHYYADVIEAGDAVIDCNSSGVGSLFWKVPLRRDYAIGHYHYFFTWSYFYRSPNHNSLAGQFNHAWARPRFGLEQIGTHSILEIVRVVTHFQLSTTV
jgi:hypothetical protein